MTVAIAIASVLIYLTGWEYTAKWRFRAMRPFTEPLSCLSEDNSWHKHSEYCYSKGAIVTTKQDAALWAALQGLIWPLFGLAWLVIVHIQKGESKPTPAETRAAIERIERELKNPGEYPE
jgi:hypothetical protein